jgi:hypothetical protein
VKVLDTSPFRGPVLELPVAATVPQANGLKGFGFRFRISLPLLLSSVTVLAFVAGSFALYRLGGPAVLGLIAKNSVAPTIGSHPGEVRKSERVGVDAQASQVPTVRSEKSARQCDELAGSPDDPKAEGAGVPFEMIDVAAAIDSCRTAVAEFPTQTRQLFQLGRALERGGRISEAKAAYERAASFQYAAALNNLGEIYRDGKGVDRDRGRARNLFEAARLGGSEEAGRNLDGLAREADAAVPGRWLRSSLPSCAGDYNSSNFDRCYSERNIPGGDRYTGEYVDGKAHGKGAYHFSDGRRFVGEYAGGKRNGRGVEYRADGSVASEGYWIDGVYQGK